MAYWISWIVSLLLVAVFLFLTVMNAGVLWMICTKDRAPSWVPIFGGIFGMAALLIVPIHSLHRWWWIPLFVDLGCIPGILDMAIWHLRRIWTERR